MIWDFLRLLVGMVGQLWRDSHIMFLTVLAIGAVLGGLSWWLASRVALSFNRQFSFHTKHHVYCGVAATITVVFTVLFSSFSYTGVVAGHMVDKWKDAVLQDKGWGQNTFREAYEAVFKLHDASGKQLENFAAYPHPDTGRGSVIPTYHEESKQLTAQTYAKAAVDHFQSHHPFLSKILWADSETAQQVITKDMGRVFASGSHVYQLKDAIQLSSEKIQQGLKEQVPRVVIISRIILIVVFLLVQGIVFLLLIRAALKDIKEHRASSRYVGG